MERSDLQADHEAAIKKPSLLFLSHEFPPLGGGAGLNGFYLCEELHARGWLVRVITQRPPHGAAQTYAFPISYVASFRTRNLQTKFSSMLLFIARTFAVAVKRRQAYTVIFSNMAIPAGIAGALISALWKLPHVVWHHGGDVHGGKLSGAGLFQRMLLRRIWKKAKSNCFVSEGLCALAKSYGGLFNEAVIPVAPRIIPAALEHGQTNDRYFLFLGRLEKVKNPLLLIAAMNTLKKSTSVMPTLRIIGDGKLYNGLSKEIHKHGLEQFVMLEKNISHDRVYGILQSAYALICPSIIEGFNMTILEAAQCGVPAIGSNVPEVNVIIKHGTTGLLFEGGNAAHLAVCIKELYESPSLRDILGKNAAQAASEFSIARSADAFERICREKLGVKFPARRE